MAGIPARHDGEEVDSVDVLSVSLLGQSEGVDGFYMFFPKQCGHLGVLTVGEKQVCLDRCAARACAANSLQFTVH